MIRLCKRLTAVLLCMALGIAALPVSAASAAVRCGDIDANGDHDMIDAMLVYRQVSGEDVLDAAQKKRADYYFDDALDMMDAVHLYSFVSGNSARHPGTAVVRDGITDESVYMNNIKVHNTCTNKIFTAATKADLQMAVAEVVRYEIGMSTFGQNSPEAWKAFAVAAYTLLARHCYNGSAYEIYMGRDIDLSDSNDRRIYDACGEVLGIKVAYDDPRRSAKNQLVEMFYSASSAGITCTTLNAWSYSDLEYLRPVSSPYDNDEWISRCSGGTDRLHHSFSITKDELISCLKRWEGVDQIYAEATDGQFWLYPRRTDGPYWAWSNLYYYNASGAVNYISGVDIYMAINLYGRPHCYSHAMTVTAQNGDTLTIETKGNGHGVGISQYGAAGFANEAGWTYDQILAHYYSITDTSAWGLVGPKW